MMQVTIIGLGMVGGSLGMALRQAIVEDKVEPFRVVGYDEDAKVQRSARLAGVIDEGANSLEEAVQEADIIVIATEPQVVGAVLQEIGPQLRPGTIVTDTASTKLQVLRWADQFLPPQVSFVGGHPVFAPEHNVDWEAGLKGASPDYFVDAIYCLAPSPNAAGEAVETLNGLVNLIGASPYYLDPMEHDGLIAGSSHAPYLVMASMLHTMASSASWREVKLLSDSDFRYLSWLVAARTDDFYQASLTNRQPLVSWLDRVIAILREMRQELADETSSGETVLAVIREAHAARLDWIKKRDEREGEAGSKTGPELETPGQQILHMFVPRFFRRRKDEEEE
jgi:prephenate dehydrogenase